MNLFINLTIFLLFLFLGFAIGRIGDKYGGHLNAPHHWIYGVILFFLGIIFFDKYFGLILISFGIGHFISDFDDFLNMRFYGVDIPHKWKFWSTK